MTQHQFAKTFGIGYTALRHWEYGTRSPRGPARSLLTIIDKETEAALRALAPTKKKRS